MRSVQEFLRYNDARYLEITMDDGDVPPLEDLTEAVHRTRALRTQLQGDGSCSRDEPRMRSNGGAAQSRRGVAGAETVLRKSAEPEEAQGVTSQSFGGFAKGFLLSTPSGPSPSTRSHNSAGNSNPSQPDCDTHKEGSTFTKSGTESSKSGLALDGDGNIPFLKPKATAKGPVFPEVQEAMKDAYPLLNTQEWLTESLLEKMEKHPLLSKALQDPHLARAMSQFQSNPKAVLQSAAGNPELQTFLKEFCSVMGDHFSDLADKDDAKKSPNAPDSVPMAEDVEKVLGKKGVREALTDPQIQRLLGLLREDPVKAQRMLASATPELQQKVQLLIDNGLLALQ